MLYTTVRAPRLRHRCKLHVRTESSQTHPKNCSQNPTICVLSLCSLARISLSRQIVQSEGKAMNLRSKLSPHVHCTSIRRVRFEHSCLPPSNRLWFQFMAKSSSICRPTAYAQRRCFGCLTRMAADPSPIPSCTQPSRQRSAWTLTRTRWRGSSETLTRMETRRSLTKNFVKN